MKNELGHPEARSVFEVKPVSKPKFPPEEGLSLETEPASSPAKKVEKPVMPEAPEQKRL